MLDVFKARLKAKAKALGVNLSQKRIDAYADRLHKKNPDVKEEAEHDTLVDELDEVVDLKEIARLDDQIRTHDSKPKPKPAPKNDDQDDDEEEDDSSSSGKPKKDRTPAWAKTLMAEVQTLKAEKVQTSIKSKIVEKLKDKGIPEKYWNKWALPDADDKIDDFVGEIETGWTELKQEDNNAALSSSSKPSGGTGAAKDANVDKDIEAWASAGKQSETAK